MLKTNLMCAMALASGFGLASVCSMSAEGDDSTGAGGDNGGPSEAAELTSQSEVESEDTELDDLDDDY